MSDVTNEIEAAFRRHLEANEYAKDLIQRIALDVFAVIRRAPAAPATPARDDLLAENERLRNAFVKIEKAGLGGYLTPDLVAEITCAALRDAGGTDGN